ncbi:intraflagellar transport protein 57 homolog [Syngnathus typhle]|uniref:intraflagellar transport protein 57 homolog n=1 Tax=Syngnathus typhle TaxID=161592 RepID=UPI002A6B1D1A|nr:intraflagellar transport protein 57 homolog [Syngnathus typhle]
MTRPPDGAAPLHRVEKRCVNIATRRRTARSASRFLARDARPPVGRPEPSRGAHMAQQQQRRGDEDERGGPGAAYRPFVAMERLLHKLHILNYQDQVLAKHNMRNLSRHYFVSSPYVESNPGEQFYMFGIIAAWLINAAGRPFHERADYGEPGAAVADILAELRALGVRVDFPPSKLLSGSGEQVCFMLDRLAEEALKKRGFSFGSPEYPAESTAGEAAAAAEDARVNVVEEEEEGEWRREEEVAAQPEDEEQTPDLEALKLRSARPRAKVPCVDTEILESMVDAAEWYLEVERALPRLTVKNDNKDWRIHVEQMHRHRDGISSSFREAEGYLGKLREDIGKTLEKVRTREKYVNNQLEHLIHDYRQAQAQLGRAKEQFQRASEGLTEKARVLADMDDELKRVKRETERRNGSVSDGAPLLTIKRCMADQNQEMVLLDKMIASWRLQMKTGGGSLLHAHASVSPEHTWTWDS